MSDMKFYRYDIVNYAVHDADGELVSPTYPNPKLELSVYTLHKETPKGYWIGYGDTILGSIRCCSRWVSKTSKKRYAYPTQEEALKSFIFRQKYALKILEHQILNRKFALQDAEIMYEKEFAKKPQRFIKDETFTGHFEYDDLVREVGTERVFLYGEFTGGCNHNPKFERVIDLVHKPYTYTFEDGKNYIN